METTASWVTTVRRAIATAIAALLLVLGATGVTGVESAAAGIGGVDIDTGAGDPDGLSNIAVSQVVTRASFARGGEAAADENPTVELTHQAPTDGTTCVVARASFSVWAGNSCA